MLCDVFSNARCWVGEIVSAVHLVMIQQELHMPSVGCSCMAFRLKGICKNDDLLFFKLFI